MSTHSPERTDDGKTPVWYRQHSTDTPDMHDLGEMPPELALQVKNSLVEMDARDAVVAASVALRNSATGTPRFHDAYFAWLKAIRDYEAVTS